MSEHETADTNTCKCDHLFELVHIARDAVSRAYAVERSRYRSLELAKAAQTLDALSDAVSE